MYAQHPVGVESLELSDKCASGPYCVSGAVTGQNGAPIAGVRCVAEWFEQEPTVVLSDRRGLFAMVGLRALPRKLRFEKEGFETQPVSIVEELRRRAALADAAAAQVVAQEAGGAAMAKTGGSPASVSGAEGSGGIESPGEASNQIRPDAGPGRKLIGDDWSANDDDKSPDQLFDFGDGNTIRLVVTMRRH